jgi:hypothetical protein
MTAVTENIISQPMSLPIGTLVNALYSDGPFEK